MIAAVGAAVLIFLFLFWKELLYISFDEEAARAQGLPVRTLNMLLMVTAALTVTATMQVVGVLLTGALTVIPVVAATQLGRGFRFTAAAAIAISLVAVGLGLFLASAFDLSPGGAIVMAALLVFLLIIVMRKLFRR